jgi:hypothetical protein
MSAPWKGTPAFEPVLVGGQDGKWRYELVLDDLGHLHVASTRPQPTMPKA